MPRDQRGTLWCAVVYVTSSMSNVAIIGQVCCGLVRLVSPSPSWLGPPATFAGNHLRHRTMAQKESDGLCTRAATLGLDRLDSTLLLFCNSHADCQPNRHGLYNVAYRCGWTRNTLWPSLVFEVAMDDSQTTMVAALSNIQRCIWRREVLSDDEANDTSR